MFCLVDRSSIRPFVRSLVSARLLQMRSHWKRKRKLREYGFDIRFSKGHMTVLKDGGEVYVSDGVRSPYDSSYVMAILRHWLRLRDEGFNVLLDRNSIMLAKDGTKVHITQVDKQPWIGDYLNALINHWETISVNSKGEITAIAGVTIRGTSVLLHYGGVDLEYEIPENWMHRDLEEVFFFPDILPNYVRGVWLKSGDIVFDLGGYHGLFSIAAAVDVGPKGKVYCFEPDPVNNAIARRNLARNGIRHVEIVPKIMSGQCGQRQFVLSASFSSHIVEEGQEGEPLSAVVESTTLWDYCAQRSIEQPNFVKADIEGAEIDLVNQNKQWIADRDIVFSIASYHRVNGEPTWRQLERIFRDLGYEVVTTHRGHTTTIARKHRV
jgi:FkbM family methyltransferase